MCLILVLSISSLSYDTSAINLWAKAAEATSDIVKDLTKPVSEEDFKFPRPPTAAERQVHTILGFLFFQLLPVLYY